MKIVENSKNATSGTFPTGRFVAERENTFRKHIHQLLVEGTEYAVPFLDFLKPFFAANGNRLTNELMLYMGMMAWNFANVRHMAPGFYPGFKLNAAMN